MNQSCKVNPWLTCGLGFCGTSESNFKLFQNECISTAGYNFSSVLMFESWFAVSVTSNSLWRCQYLQLTLILNYFQALLVLDSYKEVKLLGQGKNAPYCIKPFNFFHSPWHQVECSDLKDPHSLHHLRYISMSGGWRNFSCQ